MNSSGGAGRGNAPCIAFSLVEVDSQALVPERRRSRLVTQRQRSPNQAAIFRLRKAVGIAGERFKRCTISYDDPPAMAFDCVFAFKYVKRTCDTGSPDAKHISQLFVRHGDLIAFDAVVVQ